MKIIIRLFFTIAVIFSVGQKTWSQNKKSSKSMEVVKTSESPYAKLKGVDITDIVWTDGFWKDRVDLVRNITIPFLHKVMNMEDQGKTVHNFEIAAGLKVGSYKGNDWQDAWLYKWIEMAVASYAITKDESLDEKMDDLIALIAKAQAGDGYISTNIQVRGNKRFERPLNHEWYNMGHLLTAAALHHRITGKTSFLDVANKVCYYGYTMFKEHNKDMAHFPINPSIIMGAVEMYRETGDKKQLDLAEMVVDIRGKYSGGTDNWQDKIPLREETQVIGHAVWYTYLYAGAADVYMETGDNALISALDRVWHDLVENKMYVHGGACALYRGYGFREDGEVHAADEVFESVGLPFQQPNAYGYNETCGQVGNFMWNYRMLNITGEPRFAEIMENEMYNGFLGSMGQDGVGFFYVNPLRWHGEEQFIIGNSALQRGVPGSKNIGTCCPTNYSRSLVALQGMLYSKTENTFWIHHFGANNYDDGNIVFEEKTKFPWEGMVEFDFKKIPSNYTLKIRIPDWAEGTKVTVNGEELKKNIKASSYLTITNLKNKNNRILVEFPMEVKLLTGNPKIEETLNQVAIKRGPLLYTLEEIDLPEDISIEEVVLPVDIEFEPSYKSGLLNGITVLNGNARYFKKQNWDKKMYQQLKRPQLKDFSLTLIPYYTWANRGVTKMSVWIPVDY